MGAAPSSQPITQSTFDALYLAHQPTAVQELMEVQDFEQRSAEGIKLAIQGYLIDVPIMIWGWDPFLVMSQRISYGYTWVPSALMGPVNLAPGVSQPGAIAYDPNSPPQGAIKVSLNPSDYPPFIPPPPPVVVIPATSLVGVSLRNGFWQAIGNVLPNGKVLKDEESYTDPDGRGQFKYRQALNGFTGSVSRWFEGPV